MGSRFKSGLKRSDLRKMAEKKKDKSEEVVEYLLDKSEEVVDYAKKQRWWNKIFGKNSGPVAEKYDVATQLAIGGVSGWCAGYLFQKVGKLAASAVGGGFFLLQIANHTGYIKVDWKRVERDVNKAKKQLKLNTEKPSKEVRTKVDEVQTFVVKNIVLTGGFAGGFLLGLAS
ncbi:FUN14 domain-containing protein 1A-like [Oncorhynchus nerka]|uniref:FUN14 domain-containing protein 1A-like n=1 Tax=Oncorhynchus nerka TaxID=8023 RepID=UPI00113213D9|nr:FUN14 domain-containing protein 1A-like [Oncorhynchus nerka]